MCVDPKKPDTLLRFDLDCNWKIVILPDSYFHFSLMYRCVHSSLFHQLFNHLTNKHRIFIKRAEKLSLRALLRQQGYNILLIRRRVSDRYMRTGFKVAPSLTGSNFLPILAASKTFTQCFHGWKKYRQGMSYSFLCWDQIVYNTTGSSSKIQKS